MKNNNIVWKKGLVEKKIIEVSNLFNKGTMPTKKQCDEYMGNCSLSNKISKSGGFNYWADKLNLKRSKSETNKGKKYENILEKYLNETYGYKIKQMSTKFPYDILVEDFIKIDVKIGNLYNYNNGNYYSFNLETKDIKCDFFVCYALNEDKEIGKVYIIPSFIMQGKIQLSIGQINSKYDKYLDAWYLIEKYINFKENLKRIV